MTCILIKLFTGIFTIGTMDHFVQSGDNSIRLQTKKIEYAALTQHQEARMLCCDTDMAITKNANSGQYICDPDSY